MPLLIFDQSNFLIFGNLSHYFLSHYAEKAFTWFTFLSLCYRSNDASTLDSSAQSVRDEGILVFSVGVGFASELELRVSFEYFLCCKCVTGHDSNHFCWFIAKLVLFMKLLHAFVCFVCS